MTGAFVVLLVASVDPCQAVEAAGTPDPALAKVYVKVAKAERSDSAAAQAFAQAAALDPNNAEARDGLGRLCASKGRVGSSDLVAQALALMDAGRPADAAKVLRMAQTQAPTDAASLFLLEGLCWYDVGDDAQAERALEAAMRDPGLQNSARMVLSLVHLREGRAREVEEDLRGTRGDFSSTARSLSRLAARGGKVVVQGDVAATFDSNPTLVAGALFAGPVDAAVDAAVSALIRPLGPNGPYVRVGATTRQYFTSRATDWDSANLSAGFHLGRRGNQVSAEWRLEGALFGETPYLWLHGPRVQGSLEVGPLLVVADYALQFESYVPAAVGDFSGLNHEGSLGVVISASSRWLLEVDWAVNRDGAVRPELASFGHGPRARLSALFEGLRVIAFGQLAFRHWDAVDPDLLLQRNEVAVQAQLRGEYDVSTHFALFATVTGQHVAGNVAALSWERLVVSAGVSATRGFF